PESVTGFFGHHMTCPQTFFPKWDRIARNREAYRRHLSATACASSHAGPREKSNNCSRTPNVISEVKVVAARVIEIDRPFDQAQAECLGVEIEICLRISRDRGDVMDAGAAHGDFEKAKG